VDSAPNNRFTKQSFFVNPQETTIVDEGIVICFMVTTIRMVNQQC
jgi:hypothetical protein